MLTKTTKTDRVRTISLPRQAGCEPIRERPTDAQDAGGLVDREHRRQAIEVAFGVASGSHGKFRSTPM